MPPLIKAREEAVQEYKDSFMDSDDYLEILREATDEYKAALKRVDPNFDPEHYDRFLTQDEPQTPTHKNLVGFE